MKRKSGFTLIELLVVIGIIAILAGVVIVAVNPARQFAQARNSTRQANVTAILDAIGQRMADNNGVFNCDMDGDDAVDPFPATALPIASSTAGTIVDELTLHDCIVPTYISILPVDPQTGSAVQAGTGAYSSAYSVSQDATTGRITVSAVGELSATISSTR